MSHSSVVGLLNLRLTYPGSQYELGCLRAFFRFSLSAFFRGGVGGMRIKWPVQLSDNSSLDQLQDTHETSVFDSQRPKKVCLNFALVLRGSGFLMIVVEPKPDKIRSGQSQQTHVTRWTNQNSQQHMQPVLSAGKRATCAKRGKMRVSHVTIGLGLLLIGWKKKNKFVLIG